MNEHFGTPRSIEQDKPLDRILKRIAVSDLDRLKIALVLSGAQRAAAVTLEEGGEPHRFIDELAMHGLVAIPVPHADRAVFAVAASRADADHLAHHAEHMKNKTWLSKLLPFRAPARGNAGRDELRSFEDSLKSRAPTLYRRLKESGAFRSLGDVIEPRAH